MAADTSARKGGLILTDKAIDPTVDGEILRNKEELKTNLENAAQKLVPLRFPGVHPGLNQLRNPSFEVDANGVTPPTGWTISAGTAVVDTSQYYDGAKSCLIAAASPIDSRFYQTVNIKKGQYVRVSIACKASTVSHARIRIQVNGGDYVWYVVQGTLHTGGGTWEILSAVFGAATSDTTVYFVPWKLTATATDIWFDHAVLEVFDAPVFPISTFSGVNTDTISEKTAAAGVTIDGVLVKDGKVDGRDPSVDGAKLDTIQLAASVVTPAVVTLTDADTYYDLASKTVTIPANTTYYFQISGAYQGVPGAAMRFDIRLVTDADAVIAGPYTLDGATYHPMHIATVYAVVNGTGSPVDRLLKLQGMGSSAGQNVGYINLSVVRTGTTGL